MRERRLTGQPESIREACRVLEEAIGAPGDGMPEDVFLFVSSITPLVNVDLLVKDERGRTLLTWRDDEFYGAGWHVPGGIIRFRETLDTRIRETARRELGADVEYEPAPAAITEAIDGSRSERGHFVSLLYRCRLLNPPDEQRRAGAAPVEGEWRWHERCPDNLIGAQTPYRRFL